MINPKVIKPPFVALPLIVISIALHHFLKPPRLFPVSLNWIGILLTVSGFSLMGWAHQLFGKHETPVKHSESPTKTVLEGPYQFSRNPMYVGGLVMFLGIAILVGTWPFFLYTVLMFLVLDRIYVPWEEKTMENLFGDEYKDFKKRTRRWI